MSVLFLSTDPETLAGKLADAIDRQMREGDFFQPIPVVVPNRYLGKWLRLTLARKLGVVVNLRFLFLEAALWEWFQLLDPRNHPSPPELLDPISYRFLVLHVLLHEKDANLELLQHYVQLERDQPLSRLSCRRAWTLADRLAGFIRDYEYHRQYPLIRPWLRGELGLDPKSYLSPLERSQRAIFSNITRLPDGRRERLIRETGRLFKTLPQYGNEVMEQSEHRPPPPGTVHLFGITQISPWHVEALRWLGIHLDMSFYQINPLIGRLNGQPNLASLESLARTYSQDQRLYDSQPGEELMQVWGRAGAESLGLIAGFLTSGSFHADVLSSQLWRGRRPRQPSVLARLQEHLFLPHRVQEASRSPQDTSLQIFACPGVLREVETVHNSILKNLHDHPDLKQTDIAILVTDMKTYRPYLQTVFERPPRHLAYNLIDFSAVGLSVFGQALIGMFDLILESFTRSLVFKVLLNPCFLAKLGVDHRRAMAWVTWAESLGIYQGWDAEEKAEQGFNSSPLYAWRLGLQRLRLGRYMEVVSDDSEATVPRFNDIIPYADLESSDPELLDRFVQAVEGLLPSLQSLRKFQGTANDWTEEIRRLVHTFLAIPEDRPEEGQVRDRLLTSLETLALWDKLGPAGARPAPLAPALVREILTTHLETIEGSHGEYLTGGVTLSALQPMRPVPFSILYILGLGEQHFPGSNFLAPMDLRNQERHPGDIRPAEYQRFLFLEAIGSARKKLYLSYNGLDLAKDQELMPSVPVQQLQRYLSRHLLAEKFKVVKIPLYGHDPLYLDEARQPKYQDVLTQYRTLERLMAAREAQHRKRLSLTLTDRWEWNEQMAEVSPDFSLASVPTRVERRIPVLSSRELRGFLMNPADAVLKRQLRLSDDEELPAQDFEPVVTSKEMGDHLVRQVLNQIVVKSAGGRFDEVLQEWPQRFEAVYDEWQLRCRVPEKGFGEVDRDSLRKEIQKRLDCGLHGFLSRHQGKTFCGPVLVGESLIPMGAKIRLPALELLALRTLPSLSSNAIRLSGTLRLAWTDRGALETLILTTSEKVEREKLSYHLIEPLLMYLILRANDQTGPEGWSSREWLQGREFRIHIAFAGGMATFDIPPNLIRPTEARDYLAQLATDFLDPASCEMLPFRVIMKAHILQVFLRAEDPERKATYPDDLAAAVREAAADTFGNLLSPMTKALGLKIPSDAYDKVRRRFTLLDRVTAMCRNPEAVIPGGEEEYEA